MPISGENRAWSLMPIGVLVPDEDRTWSLTPNDVLVSDEDYSWSLTPQPTPIVSFSSPLHHTSKKCSHKREDNVTNVISRFELLTTYIMIKCYTLTNMYPNTLLYIF